MANREKYINPFTDFGFKKLFGSEYNKDLLIIKKLLNGKLTDLDEIISISKGKYTNNLLGISFDIPLNWHVVSLNTFDNLRHKQKFQGEFDDFKEEIYNEEGLPASVITKYDLNSDEVTGIVSPTVNFNIIQRDQHKGMTLVEYADLIEGFEGFEYGLLKNFMVTKKGQVYTKDGFNFIQYDTQYLFEHQELKEGVMVEMIVVNVEFGDFFLDFSMTHCPVQGEIAYEIFEKVTQSITLNN